MGAGAIGAMSGERSEAVRQSMRKSWAARRRDYDANAAPNTALFGGVLLDLVGLRPGERVLDVATGSGVVAVEAAKRVGPGGEVVATDLVPEWEELVQERCGAAGVRNVRFAAMGAEALELEDESFDVALCQFGLMFVPDPVRALREMRRVLRPDGRLGVVVWSVAERAPCVGLSDRVLAPLLSQVPPEQRMPTPLALSEPGLIERHVEAAGFRECSSEKHTLVYVAGEPEEEWRYRVPEGPPTVREVYGRLSAAEQEALRRRFLEEMEKYRSEGQIRMPSEAIYVLGRK